METMQRASGIAATYYYASDLGRATKFYSELLGMEPAFSHEGVASEWTFPGGEAFGLYRPQGGEIKTSHAVMFEVPDVQAALAEHKARGVKFLEHVEDTPQCFMAFGEDTEGNSFILHQRK